MSHPYDESDPITPNPPIPGKGVWTTVPIPDDNNDRDAATYGAGLEACADRATWLAWRMVNGLESNATGTAYPANIFWGGNHTFKAGTLTTIAGVLAIPGSISGNVTIAGSLTVNTGLTVGGAAAFSGGGTFNGSGSYTFSRPLVRTGANAYAGIRVATGPDTGSSGTPTDINPWEQDTWIISITASRVWKMASPPAPCRVSFVFNSAAGVTLELRTFANATLVTIGASPLPRSVVLVWTGTIWAFESHSVF